MRHTASAAGGSAGWAGGSAAAAGAAGGAGADAAGGAGAGAAGGAGAGAAGATGAGAAGGAEAWGLGCCAPGMAQPPAPAPPAGCPQPPPPLGGEPPAGSGRTRPPVSPNCPEPISAKRLGGSFISSVAPPSSTSSAPAAGCAGPEPPVPAGCWAPQDGHATIDEWARVEASTWKLVQQLTQMKSFFTSPSAGIGAGIAGGRRRRPLGGKYTLAYTSRSWQGNAWSPQPPRPVGTGRGKMSGLPVG